MSDITGIAGIIIWTEPDRHEAMAAFYRDVLELSPRSDRDGFVNFEWGDVRLTIARHSEITGPSRDPLRAMVNLAVADIEPVYSRLQAAGVEFSRPPEPEPWGGWIATFKCGCSSTAAAKASRVAICSSVSSDCSVEKNTGAGCSSDTIRASCQPASPSGPGRPAL